MIATVNMSNCKKSNCIEKNYFLAPNNDHFYTLNNQHYYNRFLKSFAAVNSVPWWRHSFETWIWRPWRRCVSSNLKECPERESPTFLLVKLFFVISHKCFTDVIRMELFVTIFWNCYFLRKVIGVTLPTLRIQYQWNFKINKVDDEFWFASKNIFNFQKRFDFI